MFRSTLRLLAIAGLLAVVLPANVTAAPEAQFAFAPNTPVGLIGTPHVWVADEGGVLHWAGDTRALAGHTVNWSIKVDLTADQLTAARRGDPWLSTGLLKMGDPIFLPKWETTEAAPTLYHIQSIQDLELFGLNGTNYGQMVLGQTEWEQRSGKPAAGLARGVLAAAVAQAAPAAPAAPAAAAPAARDVRLNRQPTIGEGRDVTFWPQKPNYKDNFSIDADIDAALKIDRMYAEEVIGKWRVVDDKSYYSYMLVYAANLDYSPEVKTLDDYAKRKIGMHCKNTGTCNLQPEKRVTVGGLPAISVESRTVHTLPWQDGRGNWATIEWLNRHVYVVYGNYGYTFRTMSALPRVFTDRADDFEESLAKVKFNY